MPAYLAPLPLPLNPLPDTAAGAAAATPDDRGTHPSGRAKRARRSSGGLPQVDGPTEGDEAAPVAAHEAGAAEGGIDEEERDDFAAVPTSSDDEGGAGAGRGGAKAGTPGADDAAAAGDTLLCTFDKVIRTRNRWRCVLRRAVLRLSGVEHFFDSVAGDMTF